MPVSSEKDIVSRSLKDFDRKYKQIRVSLHSHSFIIHKFELRYVITQPGGGVIKKKVCLGLLLQNSLANK